MEIALVLAFAAAAGVLVYRMAMRPDHPMSGAGFLAAEEPEGLPPLEAAEPRGVQPQSAAEARGETGASYVPLASGRRTWQTRLTGLVGIVILVPLAGVVFAAAMYQLGHIVNQTLSSLLAGNG